MLLALLGAPSRASAVGSAASSAPSRPYIVLIVMDGFRPDYMSLAPMRHLHWLMARGRVYDSAWVGQLESETPASHATIATGVYPRVHGVIGFAWRDRVTGGFTYMPTNIPEIEQGDLSRTIEAGGVPSISDQIHARNHNDRTISVSGEKLWASAPLGVGADYVLYGSMDPSKTATGKTIKHPRFRPRFIGNAPPVSSGYQSVSNVDGSFGGQDMFAARVAVKLVQTVRPRALLLNLPDPDIAGHYFGGMSDPTAMAGIVRGTDRAIGLVLDEYRRLGLLNKTIFVVCADHGMVDGHNRVLIHPIYNAVARADPNSLDEALQPSMGSIWLKDPQQASSLAATLAADKFGGVDGAMYKVPDSTTGTSGATGYHFEPTQATARALSPSVLRAYLDLMNTEASISGPEIILPYKEDTTGLDTGKKFHGMHGGVSWESQHIPLIIAGPGVKKGVSHFPAQLVDIAPTVERLAGLQIPSGVDGVVLADALQHAGAAEIKAQQAVQSRRSADQTAIRLHSQQQLTAEKKK